MSRRSTLLLTGVVLVLLWASRFVVDVGRDATPVDPAPFQARAAQATEVGDFGAAFAARRDAFHVLDPRDPAIRSIRAETAFQAAEALAQLARDERPDRTLEQRAGLRRSALLWLRTSRWIGPDDGRTHYLEARLHDRIHPELRAPRLAAAAYRRYLERAEDPRFADRHPEIMRSAVRSRIEFLEAK